MDIPMEKISKTRDEKEQPGKLIVDNFLKCFNHIHTHI